MLANWIRPFLYTWMCMNPNCANKINLMAVVSKFNTMRCQPTNCLYRRLVICRSFLDLWRISSQVSSLVLTVSPKWVRINVEYFTSLMEWSFSKLYSKSFFPSFFLFLEAIQERSSEWTGISFSKSNEHLIYLPPLFFKKVGSQSVQWTDFPIKMSTWLWSK